MNDNGADLTLFDSVIKGNLYLEDVKFQIEKDLGLGGFTFKSNSYSKLENFLPELTEFVQMIRSSHHSKWMKVVYRVDLTPKQYKFVQKMGGDTDENMAKAILLRIFQKVQTRKNFKV